MGRNIKYNLKPPQGGDTILSLFYYKLFLFMLCFLSPLCEGYFLLFIITTGFASLHPRLPSIILCEDFYRQRPTLRFIFSDYSYPLIKLNSSFSTPRILSNHPGSLKIFSIESFIVLHWPILVSISFKSSFFSSLFSSLF